MTMRLVLEFAVARLRFALIAIVPAMLAACGGGQQFAEGGIVGTGISNVASVGSISELGSGTITVNGTRFTTKAATVRVDGQPATVAALMVGQVVTVAGETLADGTTSAQSIDSRIELKGIVSGVDNAALAFTVLGQRVRTDALTVFAGGTFATLLNQYVQVSGFRAAPGDVLATRVDIVADAAPSPTLEVTGAILAFDATAKTFSIGAQGVDFSQVGTAFLPPGLGDGVVAKVRGTTVNAAGRLIASQITLVATAVMGPENSSVELEGLITEFAGLASFRVNGQLVDGRNAQVTGGSAVMLVNGAQVEIEGRLMQGVVVASEIEIEQASEIEIDATVEAVDAAGFTLSGTRFTVTATTQFEDRSAQALRDFGIALVRIGDRLVVNALHAQTGLVATRVVRIDVSATTPDVAAEAEGAVTEFISTASFKVAGQKVNASSARFAGGLASDLANGRIVKVVGVLSGDVLLATGVVFESADSSGKQSVSIEGTISGFVSPGNFKVAGQTVDASGASFEGGNASDLGNGKSVSVEGGSVSGVLVASKVAFKNASPQTTLEVEGTITNFVSVASFKVSGQAIDASGAKFSSGTAADLANGRKVSVVGPVINGVLKATSVEIKDAPEQAEAQVRGTITNFVSAANFTVAGRRIDASSAKFEHGSAASLANGVQVEIEGKLVGNVLVADKVSFE